MKTLSVTSKKVAVANNLSSNTVLNFTKRTKVTKLWNSLFVLVIVSGLVFVSCRDEENALVNKGEDALNKYEALHGNYQISDFSLADANTTVEINDYLFEQIGQAHNYYLENIIKDFDFNAKNYEQELQNRILNVNISADKLPMSYRNKLVDDLSMNTKRVKSGNKLMAGDADLMAMTLEDVIATINATSLSDKNVLIEYITNISSYLTSEDNVDNHSVFCSKLDAYKQDAINNPQISDTSVMVVKAYIELLKASSEFWYPAEYGGNGIGAEFLESINPTQENDKSKINRFQKEAAKPKDLTAGQEAAVADGFAMSAGWIGVAIGAATAPVTAGFSLGWAIANMAIGTAISSGTAALMGGGGSGGGGGNDGQPGGNGNNNPGGGNNNNGNGNGSGGSKGGNGGSGNGGNGGKK